MKLSSKQRQSSPTQNLIKIIKTQNTKRYKSANMKNQQHFTPFKFALRESSNMQMIMQSTKLRQSIKSQTSYRALQFAEQILKKIENQNNKIEQKKQRLFALKNRIKKISKDFSPNLPTAATESTTSISNNFEKIKQKINYYQSKFINKKQIKYICGRQCFKILKHINSGIFKSIYIAQNVQSKIICSIKSITKSNLTPFDQINIQQQIKNQYFLKHPNIMQLYNIQNDQKYIYLIYEPFIGKDLSYILKKQKPKGFQQNQVKSIIRQICKAVQYMHSKNITNKYIKSQNILYFNKIAKIFQFSQNNQNNKNRNDLLIYSSIQIIKKQHQENKIDIFNIGILTYQLLHGYKPFKINIQYDFSKIVHEYLQRSSKKQYILKNQPKQPYSLYKAVQITTQQVDSAQKMPSNMIFCKKIKNLDGVFFEE